MSLKVKGTRLMVALFLCVSAFGQAPPGSRAAQRLEEYRQSKAATLRDDFGELARYRAPNAGLKPAAPDEKRVVFFGDSITDMWHLAEYFPGKPYINRGISGQTTPQMLLRFRQDVIALAPKVSVILSGANCINVVFASILPVNNYTPESQDFFAQRSPQKIVELNRWLKSYSAEHGEVYLDYFSPMVDEKGLLKRDLAEDGLHPNKAGYSIMSPLA